MFAKINGVKYFFDVEGKEYVPDGPVLRRRPVCFVLHGGPGCDHTHFLPGMQQMAQYMQLIYVDHRGCGRSGPAPVETYTMEQNADDVDALREYLGLDKVFVFGHSYGGMVAQAYGLRHQENLYGLIVSSSAPSYRIYDTMPVEIEKRATDEMKKEMDIFWNRPDLTEEDYKRYMKALNPLYSFHYNQKEDDDGVDRGIWSKDAFLFGNQNFLRTFDFVPVLPTIKVPTLVIVGEEDFITPPVHSKEIAEAIPNSELVVLPEASHNTYTDQPELFANALRDFIYGHFQD